jgi:uncharacterized BrkB/YihY/UPF0761 family membrane protein
LLLAVGLAGFFTTDATPEAIGVTGSLATQIEGALEQPGTTRWIATVTGLLGVFTTGRTLSKAMIQASCLVWRLPMRSKAPVRMVGALIGLFVGIGIVAVVVNRLRLHLGVGAAGVSFCVALGVYTVVWLLLSSLLPRPTSDPGVLLPGAVLVGLTITGLQAISQLYLPDRFSRASELYGAMGVAIVTLGWFFIMGRVIVLSLVVDAAVHERLGSITSRVFRLPIIRSLPLRSAWLRRTFDLEREGARDHES